MSAICEGLNVLEIGAGSMAGSMAAMVLADAGARVVKLEPPEGDSLRRHNPSGFRIWNRGKESCACDLRTAAGQEALRAMAAEADVVIEAFGPGVTKRWGVDAETLRAANPALVHCAISGFGPDGPYAGLKACDWIVAAKMGLWSRGLFSHRDGPLLKPVPWASFGAAMQSVAGIIAALLAREATGRGQSVEATLASGLEAVDYFGAVLRQLAARRKPGEADAGQIGVFSRYAVLLATKDGRLIQTTTMLPHQGKALCEVAGVTDRLSDPRFRNLPSFDTAEDAQAWEDMLLEAFLEKPLDHWRPLLEANLDIAFEIAGTSEEGLRHPQIVHNGDVITIDDPEVGPIRQVGPIGHFEKTPLAPTRPAPRLGQWRGPLVGHRAPAGGAPAPACPFAGVTIIEFGCFYAMPYGLTMLAALGARVIKIEDRAGDPHRRSFGPEVGSSKTAAGKESIALDLRTDEGKRIAQALAAKADVFVNGFRTGVPERLGLGYETLKAINPRLLYVNAAGYGADGPYARRACYAQAAATVAGSFGRQASHWSAPERVRGWDIAELRAVVFPRLHQVSDGDSNASLGLLAAIALGLYHQRRTGEGQQLNTSMIGSNAWCYSDDFCAYEGKPAIPRCDEEEYGLSALERLYRAADDGWLCIAVREQREFEALASVLGRPGLAHDPRFKDAAARRGHDAELVAALSDLIAARPAQAWEAALSAADVGAAAVSMAGIEGFTAFDPGLQAAGLTITTRHPLYGDFVRWGPSPRFSDAQGAAGPVCLHGEHNRTLLAELGYDAGAIQDLEARGVVFPPAGEQRAGAGAAA
ncbi:MAG: CoA transferase [Caulobacteraceae bacterium]|nr:CoA transferase [Caulobacteraceae bacterium]